MKKMLIIQREVKILLKKILRILFTLIGATIGYIIGEIIAKSDLSKNFPMLINGSVGQYIFIAILVIIFGLIFFFLSPLINAAITKVMDYVEKDVQRVPTYDVIVGTAGGIIGLIISTLFFSVLKNTGVGGTLFAIISVILTLIITALGVDIAIKKKDDIISIFSSIKKTSSSTKEKKNKSKYTSKILDTSVIIDGRIFDICQTGFIEGTLVIPNFVLEELRHIADSSDDLKRNRGRRGLDILNKIQNELKIPVEIVEKDFPEINEVDSKLLKLAQVMKGKVITNDFNLNKVAKFQGVAVLNINELANAVKPVVLPGEEMEIQIIKDGKEAGQGIAYLDDGTMIVVEGGKRHIGEIMNVVVTSVLQTAAGRMIFAKRKDLISR
ncbi:putative PIN and TRAM-domain containing protein precursor [Clostridium tepidiprofundi DSM 19306]|uniref:Putative PIN and TRAM-domain containing protein n=1 Tax=Clostridium tepidiprofundi DSM 19306 TaxID=1121338 RepID=A0A151B5L2_9CLOT|nr:putative PIN and TRAM-domain containing protein precursor [Clostridium tepidiprofundi DSM 19306]